MGFRVAVNEPRNGLSKLKAGLYILGIIICMAVLASIMPTTQNSISKTPLKKADKKAVSSLKIYPFNMISAQAAVQTGSGAGQAGSSSVQGSLVSHNQQFGSQPPLSGQGNNQNYGSPTPVLYPPILPQPCYSCSGIHMECPLAAWPCSGCGLPTAYACLEE